MEKLNGIKQVLRSEYESTSPGDRRNYWWLVRETETSIKGTLRPQFLPVYGSNSISGANGTGNISSSTSVCEVVIYGGQPGVNLLAIEIDLDGASQREFQYVWDEGRMLHTLHEYPSLKKVYAYLFNPTLLTDNPRKNRIGFGDSDHGPYYHTSDIDDSLIGCLSIETEYYPTSVYFGNRLYSTDPKINEVFIQNQFMRLERLLMGSGFSENGYSGLVANDISLRYIGHSNILELSKKNLIGYLFLNSFNYNGNRIHGYSFLGAFSNLYYAQRDIMGKVSLLGNKPCFDDRISRNFESLQNWAISENGGSLPDSLFRDIASLYKLTMGYNRSSGITNCFGWVYEQIRELVTSANTNLNKL